MFCSLMVESLWEFHGHEPTGNEYNFDYNICYSFQQGAIAVAQPFGYATPPPSVPGRAAQDQPADVAREPVQPQQPPVVRMNAQGGMVDDDDDEMERDWLDWFYVGVRFVLLMGILYFYSTPVRFFTTVVLILFIYWYVSIISVRCYSILIKTDQVTGLTLVCLELKYSEKIRADVNFIFIHTLS